MIIENSASGIAGFLDLAIVPIKSAFAMKAPQSEQPGSDAVTRKIGLLEEAACGVSMEKMLFSGSAATARSKALEMIVAGRKIVLQGFPLEEIANWCFKHNYRWRFHHDPFSENTFVLEPGKNFRTDAIEAGVTT
jgi:hypothetical protein